MVYWTIAHGKKKLTVEGTMVAEVGGCASVSRIITKPEGEGVGQSSRHRRKKDLLWSWNFRCLTAGHFFKNWPIFICNFKQRSPKLYALQYLSCKTVFRGEETDQSQRWVHCFPRVIHPAARADWIKREEKDRSCRAWQYCKDFQRRAMAILCTQYFTLKNPMDRGAQWVSSPWGH